MVAALLQGGLRGIVERSQHAGDVAQRRLLGAALVHASQRLALEVEDVEVVADHDDLPQMKVAVQAGLLDLRNRRQRRLDRLVDLGPAAQQRFHVEARVRRRACPPRRRAGARPAPAPPAGGSAISTWRHRSRSPARDGRPDRRRRARTHDAVRRCGCPASATALGTSRADLLRPLRCWSAPFPVGRARDRGSPA